MRRITTFCLTLGLLCTLCGAGHAADGLFSDVSINSVFAKPGGAAPAPGGQPIAPPPGQSAPDSAGLGALAATVKLAGFEPKQVSDQIVQTKVQLDKWSFPVLISSNQQKQEVVLVVLLSLVKDETQLSSAKLLELLDASREHSPAYFAYSSKRKRIELYRTVEGQAPSAQRLKTELNRLAEIAKSTETLWNLTAVQTNKPVTTSPTALPKPAATPSLAGKWSAAKSAKEAFAVQLTADGKYTLVHVADGKQTKSSGTFTLAGQQLTLAGSDGTKIAGNITSQSQQQFVFAPSGSKAAPLTFKRAT